jgi:hypothetical protein
MLGEPWVRSGTVASSGQEVPEAAARSGGLPVRDHFRPNIDRRDGYTRADTTADSVRGNACPGRRIDNSASDFAPCHCCSGPDHASARSATIRRFTCSGRETGGIANHIAHDFAAGNTIPTKPVPVRHRNSRACGSRRMLSKAPETWYRRACSTNARPVEGTGARRYGWGRLSTPVSSAGLVFAVLRATPLRPRPGIAALLTSATPPPKKNA